SPDTPSFLSYFSSLLFAIFLHHFSFPHSSVFFFYSSVPHRDLHSFPTRRSSDLRFDFLNVPFNVLVDVNVFSIDFKVCNRCHKRSEEHTSELQSRFDLVCRLLLEKKKKQKLSKIILLNNK